MTPTWVPVQCDRTALKARLNNITLSQVLGNAAVRSLYNCTMHKAAKGWTRESNRWPPMKVNINIFIIHKQALYIPHIHTNIYIYMSSSTWTYTACSRGTVLVVLPDRCYYLYTRIPPESKTYYYCMYYIVHCLPTDYASNERLKPHTGTCNSKTYISSYSIYLYESSRIRGDMYIYLR